MVKVLCVWHVWQLQQMLLSSDEKVTCFAVRFLPFWRSGILAGGTNFHFSCTVVAFVVAATTVAFHIPLAIKAGINHSHSHGQAWLATWLETSWKLAETWQLVATSYLPQNGALSLLMTRHLLQVLHDADASSDASCAAANLLSLQLNLLDLHMPNDSSFNYRVESAHFSIAHRFHRSHVASAQLSLPCPLPPLCAALSLPLLLLCLRPSCTDCPRMPEQFCTAHCTKINLQRFVCLHKPPVAEFPLPLSPLPLEHFPLALPRRSATLSSCSPLVARGPALNIAVRFSCL